MGNIESMWIIEILTRSIPRIIFHCQIYTSWLTVVPSMKNNHSWTAMLVIITSTCTLYRKLFSSHLEVFTITCGAFWVKKVEATHMRPIPTLFHDMIHKEIKIYIYSVIIKSKKYLNNLDLLKFFASLCKYNLKLNLKRYALRFLLEIYWVSLSAIKSNP